VSELFADFSSTLEFAAVYAILALAVYVAMWTGVLSLASIPVAALAGFLSSFLVVEHGWSFYPAAAVAVFACGLASWALGLALLRLDSHYIALATIGLILMTGVLVLNGGAFTGGVLGRPVPRTVDDVGIYATLGAAALGVASLRRSRFGIAAEAVRHQPEVVATLGVDPLKVQRCGCAISGVLAGVGGCLLADLLQYINATTYSSDLAFVVLASVVLGGAYHWFGALVGTVIFAFIPEVVSQFWEDGRDLLNGVILVAVMLLLPGGLVDPYRRAQRAERRARERSSIESGSPVPVLLDERPAR
jgi:branched-chain amino acid transport system permease protein